MRGMVTSQNKLPSLLPTPPQQSAQFHLLWKLQGSSVELLEIMKRHWQGFAELTEWPLCPGSQGTLTSGRTGSLLTVNYLFSFLHSLMPQSQIEMKRENGNESRSLSHVQCRSVRADRENHLMIFLKLNSYKLLSSELSPDIDNVQSAKCII